MESGKGGKVGRWEECDFIFLFCFPLSLLYSTSMIPSHNRSSWIQMRCVFVPGARDPHVPYRIESKEGFLRIG